MTRTRVGVVRGGTSGEYDLSLKTGAAVFDALPDDTYDVRDIFIDKQGFWLSRGMPTTPARALSQLDVVVNALHGGVGEDGTLQRILEKAWIPYTGSRPLPSAQSLNKILARRILTNAGIRMPQGMPFVARPGSDVHAMAREVFAAFAPPYVIKPPQDGASLGITIAQSILELPRALAVTLNTYGSALVEEFVHGEEATVGLIHDFRNEELYALPPARLEYPDECAHLHYDHHHTGAVRYLVPSDFSDSQKRALIETARAAHRALGLDQYSRADIIMTPRGPILLEVNALPGLHANAALPPMLESVGSSIPEFVRHTIGLARRG